MRFTNSSHLHVATLGVAFALGGASAHAQSVITRQVVEEPVETTVTQTPTGTVITRRPLGPTPQVGAVAIERGVAPIVPAQPYYGEPTYSPAPPATYVDETVGAGSADRIVTSRHSSVTRTHTVHASRKPDTTRNATRSVERTTTVRRVAGPPLVLDPVQRRTIYRTIVAQQVMPAQPAYPARTVVVPETTGAGYAVPAATEEEDDVYVEQTPALAPRYAVGSQVPTDVVLMPMPVTTAVQVPAVRPYRYVTLDHRVLLVDPATNTVVADITP
ncbi:MAG TPA: hypothetical protein VGH49_04950 [Xanthobacteraceae bacterium]